MPNNLVFNNVAEQLQAQISGIDGAGTARIILTDTEGSIILSTVTVTAENLDIRDLSGATDSVTVFGTVTVTAENLDIRDLSGATDSVTVFGTVTVTAENLDIRDLSGATDSIQLSSRMFTESYTTLTAVTGTDEILLQNTGEQSEYSFYVFNMGLNPVTVQLQISPTTTDSYFVNDSGGSTIVGPGSKAVLAPARFLKYTRLHYDTGILASTFEAYYNAQV